MSKYTIENPEYMATKNVDQQGRVYVGNDFAGDRVRVVIERVEESSSE